MKCPKCNYISFDYNQTCPKCKKDLVESRGKMNYPSFRPSPLSIPSFKSQGPTESVRMEQRMGFSLEETTEINFPDSQDLDIELESAPAQKAEESDLDFSLDDESDELSLDFDDLEMDDAAPVASQKKQTAAAKDSLESDLDFSFDDETDELSLDFDEPAIEDTATEALKKNQQIGIEDSIEAKLDLAFEEEDDADIDLQLTEEDEVTAAFDLSDLPIEDQGKNTPSDLEILDLDLDLEKSDNN